MGRPPGDGFREGTTGLALGTPWGDGSWAFVARDGAATIFADPEPSLKDLGLEALALVVQDGARRAGAWLDVPDIAAGIAGYDGGMLAMHRG